MEELPGCKANRLVDVTERRQKDPASNKTGGEDPHPRLSPSSAHLDGTCVPTFRSMNIHTQFKPYLS